MYLNLWDKRQEQFRVSETFAIGTFAFSSLGRSFETRKTMPLAKCLVAQRETHKRRHAAAQNHFWRHNLVEKRKKLKNWAQTRETPSCRDIYGDATFDLYFDSPRWPSATASHWRRLYLHEKGKKTATAAKRVQRKGSSSVLFCTMKKNIRKDGINWHVFVATTLGRERGWRRIQGAGQKESK